MAADDRTAAAGPRRHGMSRRQAWVTAAMAVLILIPSMYGFVGKFVEFVHIYRGAGGGEFAVALRSALVRGDHAWLFAGAGIMADSDPASELAEIEMKFTPLAGALAGGRRD